MLERCARPHASSIGKEPASSEEQLRLPLFREVSARTGCLIPNSPMTERLRYLLQFYAPSGAPLEIADELGARRRRVFDEIEGKVLLSSDVELSTLKRLEFEPRFRFFGALLTPFGFYPAVQPGALARIP